MDARGPPRRGGVMGAPSVLSGDLRAFSLADIFTLLGMSKKSGLLRLTRGAESRTLAWEQGDEPS